MDYRLGLDIGTNSIGWCLLILDEHNEPKKVIKMGSRIFPDGRTDKTGTPLNQNRREARGIRRNLDRYKMRVYNLINILHKSDMLPSDKEGQQKLISENPYKLRAEAVDEKITLHELGRALIHIIKRRGFQSNRKAGKDKEGKVKKGIEELTNLLNGRTLGQYFYELNKTQKPIRTKLLSVKKDNGRNEDKYNWYVNRQMLKDEFDKIIETQSKYHKQLTNELAGKLRHAIFHQRDLKPVVIGRCQQYGNKFDGDKGLRAYKALPIAQEFILLQKLHDLKLNNKPLSAEQFHIVYEYLSKKADAKWEELYKILGLEKSVSRFNFDRERTPKISGNKTNAIMYKNIKKWYKFTLEEQNEIVGLLIGDKPDKLVIDELFSKFKLLGPEVQLLFDKAIDELPNDVMSYCEFALKELVEKMQEGYDFTKAKQELGYKDDLSGDEALDILPKYQEILSHYCGIDPREGKIDKIANPTVHIALNQLQKLMNAIINKYGKPKEITIEIGRDLKKTKEEKKAESKRQTENEKKNKQWQEEFSHYKLSHDDKHKLRLRDEIIRSGVFCVFCGDTISNHSLLSNEVEIEHILPFSMTLDDSISNKVLACKKCNQIKRNKTPHDAFSGKRYEEILGRAIDIFPKNKSWRFQADAMEKFKDENKFTERHLNDMRYISKVAREYLEKLYDRETRKRQNVMVIPGRLTQLLRGKLGLNKLLWDADNENETKEIKAINDDDNLTFDEKNEKIREKISEKNRGDHRHHAIDALVIALTTRSLLQRVSTAASDLEGGNLRHDENTPKLFKKFKVWDRFEENVSEAVKRITVSHKYDHGVEGVLHEAGAYGLINEDGSPDDVGFRFIKRVPLSDIKYNQIDQIKDDKTRQEVGDIRNILSKKGEDLSKNQAWQEAISEYQSKNNIYSVKLKIKDSTNIILKNQRQGKDFGKNYKALVGGDNFCVEIFEQENGEIGKEIVERFHANIKGYKPKWRTEHPNAKLKLRLFKGDTVRMVIKPNEDEESPVKQELCLLKSVRLTQLGFSLLKDATNSLVLQPTYNGLFDKYKLEQIYIDTLGNIKKALPPCPDLWECGGRCDPSKSSKNCKERAINLLKRKNNERTNN